MISIYIYIYHFYTKHSIYFSKARDFWEAQLSGDAPQRLARGPQWGWSDSMGIIIHHRNNYESTNTWLVVWNIWIIFPIILGRIIPTDFHIFQRGRSTTNQILFFLVPNIWIILLMLVVSNSLGWFFHVIYGMSSFHWRTHSMIFQDGHCLHQI